jgi:hypothetical protein
VDAAQPDSLVAWLAHAIDGCLTMPARARPREFAAFASGATRCRLERLIDRRPILHEARPLAAGLASLAEAGRSALDLLAAGTQPAAGWRDEMVGTLDAAAVPVAEVEFPLVPALRRLVFGAARVGDVGKSSPQEWKSAVGGRAAPTTFSTIVLAGLRPAAADLGGEAKEPVPSSSSEPGSGTDVRAICPAPWAGRQPAAITGQRQVQHADTSRPTRLVGARSMMPVMTLAVPQ